MRGIHPYPEGTLLPTTSAASSSASPSVDFRCGARPRFTVGFSDSARAKMRREISRVAPFDIETGGLLFSLRRPTWERVEICYATPPGPLSRHSRYEFTYSVADIKREMPDFLQHLQWVGDFHTHPSHPAANEPSPADLETWATCLRQSSAEPYVSLIVTRDPEGHGWMLPRGSAFVTWREGGGFVCERAGIRD